MSCPWGEVQNLHQILKGFMNPLQFMNQGSGEGRTQGSLWPGPALWPGWPLHSTFPPVFKCTVKGSQESVFVPCWLSEASALQLWSLFLLLRLKPDQACSFLLRHHHVLSFLLLFKHNDVQCSITFRCTTKEPSL